MTKKIIAIYNTIFLKEEFSSFKMRIYPNREQEQQLNLWFYQIQHFRNDMVQFLTQRRADKILWKQTYPQQNLPETLKGSDIQAASRYLTTELQAARKNLNFFHLLSGWSGKGQGLEFIKNTLFRWGKLSVIEKKELHHTYWLLFPRTLLDQVLLDAEKTYKKAFKDRKNKKLKKKAGFPQERKITYQYSVRFQLRSDPKRQKTYVEHWNAGMIFIPALNSVLKVRDSRGLPKTVPEMVTVSRNAAGHYFVSFLNKDTSVSQLKPRIANMFIEIEHQGLLHLIPKVEAMDWSLLKHGVLTDGKSLKRERYYKKYAKRLRRQHKSLSRKQKGSSRWKKERKALGKTYTKVSDQREEELRKLAQEIVANHSILCLEDLFFAGMMKNRKLSKSIADAAPFRFKQLIKWEAQKKGHLVLECGQWEASSKTCFSCGEKNKDLKLQDREWTCQICQTTHDRDVNAANNIRWMALQRYLTLTNESASGNDEVSLSEYRLVPELEDFITHGGLNLCWLTYAPKWAQEIMEPDKFEPDRIVEEVRVSKHLLIQAQAEK